MGSEGSGQGSGRGSQAQQARRAARARGSGCVGWMDGVAHALAAASEPRGRAGAALMMRSCWRREWRMEVAWQRMRAHSASAASRVGQACADRAAATAVAKEVRCAVRFVRSMTCVLVVHDVRYVSSCDML